VSQRISEEPKNGPLVSVVTPVYNGAEYLEECVESVLAQTYENWNYTIVDNASSDATPEIAQAFAKRDSRIRHLRFEEFVDATASHNRAFEAISPESEFCKIVEGDDWLYPECLSLMVDAAGVSSTVGTVSAYQLWGRRVHLDDLPYTTTFAPGADILRGILLGCVGIGGPTATMFRSAFVRDRRPFYQEGLRHEDSEAMLWMLSRHDFAFVHQVLTFARKQSEARSTWSQTMNSSSPENILLLLRYGPAVLEDREYRARLRARLKSYIRWHIRQVPRISRLRDSRFFELHNSERALILAEANGDPDVQVAMGIVEAMLLRGRLTPLISRQVPSEVDTGVAVARHPPVTG
jgi:glycosyltransferase involved in cell wall biosynthesis